MHLLRLVDLDQSHSQWLQVAAAMNKKKNYANYGNNYIITHMYIMYNNIIMHKLIGELYIHY